MKKCNMLTVFVAASIVAFAGNQANPDAIELVPLPQPVEFKSDIDRPVAFDETVRVTVDCPDESAAAWLDAHLKEWYGKFAPAAVGGSTGLSLKDGDEAYAISADANGVKIAARTIAGVRWAAYSLRQLAIEKRGTFKTSSVVDRFMV